MLLEGGGGNRRFKNFLDGLNKCGIKLAFYFVKNKTYLYTMVHLCAPITYAKQDKQLCDSKIYDFKYEGYHTIKYISKELGYRNNRGTRETMILSRSSHSCEC